MRSPPPSFIRWSPSKSWFFVKLNFDGSMVNQGATVGFMIRNEKGEPIIVGARFIGQNTISIVECLALRDSLWMAWSKGLSCIVVKGDLKLVIEFIRGAYSPPWRLKSILEEIRWLAGFFYDICWKHVFREVNFLVNAITSIGYSVADFHVWDRTLPLAARQACLFDCTQTECPKGFSL
ncbi:ribonuclease H protein [Pyrus ussuriensis x Pyrus communis]|uniref:Ribonuclease H protein n=1 Tax=Pyrus ussuriensis x Pyrus communis TaxID=2448454 RepID=A0A5N5HEN5_9ROSA|nr:ribonuclease H protein [Pyrus ussuriensis x Pyrus communis]